MSPRDLCCGVWKVSCSAFDIGDTAVGLVADPTVLDLHATFTRCYDQGDFAAKIDYQRDPAAALNDEDRKWLNELLKPQKLR